MPVVQTTDVCVGLCAALTVKCIFEHCAVGLDLYWPQQPRQREVLLVCSADMNKLNFGGTQLGHSCLHTHTHTPEAGFAVSDEPSERDQSNKAQQKRHTHTHPHILSTKKRKKKKYNSHTHQQSYFISLGIWLNSIYIFNKLSHPQMHTAALGACLKYVNLLSDEWNIYRVTIYSCHLRNACDQL